LTESLAATILAAVAAIASLGTLYYAYGAAREGRGTVEELRNLASEASLATAAQQVMVSTIQDLVDETTASAGVLHAVFLEAQASRRVEALIDVRKALAEVAGATQRVVVDGQPSFLFYVARQSLRATLLGIPDAATCLPAATAISIQETADTARIAELEADRELNVDLELTRLSVVAAGERAAAAMNYVRRSDLVKRAASSPTWSW